ncbi:hypothetical protein UYO_2613, partial [Lachnospiraceae bacterium JC7]
MKKALVKVTAVCSAVSICTAMPAFAMVKNIEINAVLDSISEPDAGICFFPEYEVSDEDDIDTVIV